MPRERDTEGKAWGRGFVSLLLPLAVLCAPALYQGLLATRGLSWPPDDDLYRDISQAVTMADGQMLADPFYRGETIWYNPLVPLLVAGTSKLAGLPVNTIYTRAGAGMNLLAPIAFFLLVSRCFGGVVAAAATFHLLYLRDARDPPWISPSYQPWLWSAAFAQGLFFVTLLAYREALRSRTRAWAVAAGLLLGLTFLAHTAPALIMGLVIVAMVAYTATADGGLREPLRGHALPIASALAVAAPFLWSIIWRYRLRVLNPTPMSWSWAPLAPENAAAFLALQAPWATGIALLALLWLSFRDERRLEARLFVAWAVGAAAWFGYAQLSEVAARRGLVLPRLVPAHHFVLYLRAAESALVGYAVAMLARATLARVATASSRWTAPALLVGLAFGTAAAWPSYQKREAFVSARRQAEKDDAKTNREEAREWMRAHTRPDDVFLAPDDLGLVVVGPAGRKTVAVGAYFSNPYVDWESRHEARDAMLAALERGHERSFRSLASEYGVTYVILKKSDPFPRDEAASLSLRFANARIRIYHLEAPPSDR